MHLSNTSQYAIRILSYIAKYGDDRLYSAKELSDVLNISYKFLTKIMISLVNEKFVTSIKGREGGYKLNKSSSEIRVMDILNTFNEFEKTNQCLLGIGSCNETNKCALHDQWIVPKELIQKMFENSTLDKLEGENFKM